MRSTIFTFKQQILLLILLCSGMSMAAQTIHVNSGIGLVDISAPGDLKTAIDALSNKASVTELQVLSSATTQMLNADDATAINALTALKILDMSEISMSGYTFPGINLLNGNTTVETFYFPKNTTGWDGGNFTNTALKGTFTIPSTVTNQAYVMGGRAPVNNQYITDYAYNGTGTISTVDGVVVAWGNTLVIYPSGRNTEAYTVSEGITGFDQSAFIYQTKLKEVTLSSSVASFNANAFNNSPNIEKINVVAGNAKYASIDGMLIDKTEKQLVFFPPANKVESVVIDGTIAEKMSNNFFSNAKYLKRIVFTEGFKEISYSCFKMSDALNNLPMLVEYIELPSTIEVIGGEAFNTLGNLKQVICKATTPPKLGGHQVFRGANGIDLRLGVPAGSLAAYKASPWNSSLSGAPSLAEGGHEDNGVLCTYANINAVPGDQMVAYRSITMDGGTSEQDACVSGFQVKITANDALAGDAFTGWTSEPTGVQFTNSGAKITYFVMPDSDVTIKALFATAKPYTIIGATVSQSGAAGVGSSVNLETAGTRVVDGNTLYFVRWQVNKGNVVIVNPALAATSFTMVDEEVEIEAIYATAYMINISGGTSVLEAFEGDEVTITASKRANQEFTGWTTTTPGVEFASASAEVTTFIMPASEVDIKANFRDITGINDLKESQLQLYPNPATDYIQLSGAVNTKYAIYDVLGKVITEGITSGEAISVSGLANGIYIFKIDGKSIQFIKK